jgi:hypothetical protein
MISLEHYRRLRKYGAVLGHASVVGRDVPRNVFGANCDEYTQVMASPNV